MKNQFAYFSRRWACTLFLIIVAACCSLQAQNIGINEDGATPDPHAILDVKSFTKGMLIPRVSTSGRLTIPNIKGMIVYDSTANTFMYNNGATWVSVTASAGQAGNWSLTGNTGLDSSKFMGTTDSASLRFRVKNDPSGLISFTNGNTFWGYKAGLKGDTSLGLDAAGNLMILLNTGVGFQALSVNTTGKTNTGVGANALSHNSSGGANVAMGVDALFNNTTGQANTAIGEDAMALNTSGGNNTAIGTEAMFNNVKGDLNTVIGAFATIATDSLHNATAIGSFATVNASNKVRIGSSSVTVIEGAVPFTTPSDGRFKYHIQEDVKGLNFILQLRPVTYQFDVKRFDEQLNGGKKFQDGLAQSYDEASSIRRSGFIAQEVETAAKTSGYNFSGLIKPKTDQGHYSLSYESFVVPLVKGMQEQQKLIAELQQEIEALKQQIKKPSL